MTNVVGPPLQAAAATQLSRRCPCPWRDAIETHATTDASGRGGLRTPSKALAERRGGRLLGERGRGGGLLGERGRGGGRGDPAAAGHPEHLVLGVGALRALRVDRQLDVE